LWRQVYGNVAYADLLQVGRIGLWQAVLHFDAKRGVAFSTYAVVAIHRRMWQAESLFFCALLDLCGWDVSRDPSIMELESAGPSDGGLPLVSPRGCT